MSNAMNGYLSGRTSRAHALQWKGEGEGHAEKEHSATRAERHAGAFRGDHPPHRCLHTYLDKEYVQLSRELTAALCRKRPSPLERGKATVWACGIIYALGMVNFLFDSSQTPHLAVSQIWEYFKLSSSTMKAKSKQIRDCWACIPWIPIGRLPRWRTRIP